MSDKNFFWIKLYTDFFADRGAIDYLLSQPNGAEYVVLYLKLCLAVANTNGQLGFQIGEVLVPYEAEKIAEDMKFSVDTVEIALSVYQRFGLIYEEKNGLLAIKDFDKMVGSETKWAKYKRQERLGQKLDNELENVQESIEIRDKSIEIRDKRKRKEIERHKYGEYQNVLLSDEELEKLQNEFADDWQERIENLSSYMRSTGKSYKDHLATIRNWARKNNTTTKTTKSRIDLLRDL